MNVSVTFRNVKKLKPLRADLISLVEKHGLNSAGIVEGWEDVLNPLAFVKYKTEKNYILQYDDHACQLIVFMNAYLWKHGKLPIRYKSNSFYDLLDECCGAPHAPVRNIEPALRKFKMAMKWNYCKSLNGLKIWIKNQLKQGNPIDFCLINKKSLHSCLIIKYFSQYDSFKVINAKENTNENPVEYLTWEQLIKNIPSNSHSDTQAVFNNTVAIFFTN